MIPSSDSLSSQIPPIILPHTPPLVKLMGLRQSDLEMSTAGLKETGISLISTYNGNFYPSGSTDDTGLYFFIPKLATLFNLSPMQAWDGFFIVVLATAFIIGLRQGLRLLQTQISKVVFAILYFVLAIVVSLSGDIYMIAPCVSVAFAPAIYTFLTTRISIAPNHWAICVLLGVLFGAAHLVRSHSATAILIFGGVLLFAISKIDFQKKCLLALLVAVGFFLPKLYFNHLYDERDEFLKTKNQGYQPAPRQHTLWASVYIGLGFLDNELQIRYKDEFAHRKARELAPKAQFASKEFDDALGSEVWKIARENPMFILRTVSAKLGVIGFYILLFGNIGLFLAIRYASVIWIDLAFWGAIAFNALPGVLVMPNIPYISGSFAFALIYGIISFDKALQQGFLKKTST